MNIVALNPYWAHEADPVADFFGQYGFAVVCLTSMIILAIVFCLWLWRTLPEPPFTREQEQRIQEIIQEEEKHKQ